MWNYTLLFKSEGQGTWSKSTARAAFTFNTKLRTMNSVWGSLEWILYQGKILKLEGTCWPKYHPAESGLFRAVQDSTEVSWFGSRSTRVA